MEKSVTLVHTSHMGTTNYYFELLSLLLFSTAALRIIRIFLCCILFGLHFTSFRFQFKSIAISVS